MNRWARILCATLLSLGAASCLTPRPLTQVKTLWKDPQFDPGRFHQALVIGVFPDLERRQLFEKEFAGQLRPYGVKALVSSKFLPDIAAVDRPKVEALVKAQHVDVVFITRLLSKTTIQTEVAGHTTLVPPGPMDGAVSYFDQGLKEVSTPGYTVDQTVAILETKVFETAGGTCVWTCRSDTLVNGYLDDLIRGFARVMTQALYAPRG